MRNKLFTTGAAILAAAALGLGSTSLAQSEFSDGAVEAYAAATVAVQDIQQEWIPRIQNADTAAQKEELRNEATNEMIQAIQAQGLSVDEYNAITEAARNEPQLVQRIQEHMQN